MACVLGAEADDLAAEEGVGSGEGVGRGDVVGAVVLLEVDISLSRADLRSCARCVLSGGGRSTGSAGEGAGPDGDAVRAGLVGRLGWGAGDGEGRAEAVGGRNVVQMSCRISRSCAMRRSMSREA